MTQFSSFEKPVVTQWTSTVYTLDLPQLTALTDVVMFINFHVACGVSPTLEINSLGAKALKDSNGNALASGAIATDQTLEVMYDVSKGYFQILNTMTSVVTNGTIVTSFNKAIATTTLKAGEAININQQCCKTTYRIKLPTYADVLKTNVYGGSSVVNYWQCFEWKATANLSTLNALLVSSPTRNSGTSYSLTAKVYAISGTYGVNAVKTGSALYTSNTITGSANNVSAETFWWLTFTFNVSIPVWQYVVMIEGNAWGNGNVTIRGDLTGSYYWNSVDNTTPKPGENMYMVFNSTTTVAMLADASDIFLSDWVWYASETKTVNNNIILNTTGEITQIGALNDRTLWYLANTPGTLSLTAGTNVRLLAQGSGIDKVYLGRDSNDEILITNDVVYYTNTSGIAWGYFHAYFSWVNTWGMVIIQISPDNVTWRSRATFWFINGAWGYNDPAGECSIPAGYYFKVVFSWGDTQQNKYSYFRPTK